MYKNNFGTDDPHELGVKTIEKLDEIFNRGPAFKRMTTDEIAEFWHGATEACTLRLIRLKPELVRPADDDD